ncbi:hypothetical protein ACFQ6N_17595 [Kitasatospora sp. NPDC056446]|uniref:hypothetical protein n=1 Tax=Kitasatospora sp. NPDC056446 TaxID=3345819 RepID=UPI00367EEB0E
MIIKAATTVALALTALTATAGSAFATGDWASQIGTTNRGCYAWSTFTSNSIAGHVYSQTGDKCEVWIVQNGHWQGPFATSGSGTVIDTWTNSYGPGVGVFIYAQDDTQGGSTTSPVYGG